MNANILVVEDDPILAQVLADNLVLEGYNVHRAATARVAMQLARDVAPDLIILDVMLPDSSGFEMFETLCEDGRRPIIFLTARGDTSDKLKGLSLGADDYITKPFELREVLARVRAVLRRTMHDVDVVMLGDLRIDFGAQAAERRGRTLHLTHREFQLLHFLAVRAGRVVSRGELLRALWGFADDEVNTRSVDHAVARIRKKIEPDPDAPRYIHTVRGDGYSLTPTRHEAATRRTSRTGRIS